MLTVNQVAWVIVALSGFVACVGCVLVNVVLQARKHDATAIRAYTCATPLRRFPR
jgi:NADH:ubiquinone oxidoreductase subunit 3 (subunit A)